MPVVHSTTIPAPGAAAPTPLPEVAPAQGEPSVAARADKFINTDLDAILKKTNASTLVVVGSASNGAVMYTSFHANVLGYTVVVAVDGMSAEPPSVTTMAQYQLLNQPGITNADNKPLADKMVTLSKTDLITIKYPEGYSQTSSSFPIRTMSPEWTPARSSALVTPRRLSCVWR